MKTTKTIIIAEITRQQLYEEVWTSPLITLSKKYGIEYHQFLNQIKNVDIPIPPRGYWTKLEYGKAEPRPPLAGNVEETIQLYRKDSISAPTHEEETKKERTPSKPKPKLPKIKKTPTANKKPAINHMPEPCSSLAEAPKTETGYGRVYNIYERQTLYNEIWSAPATRVAQKYNVSDVAIHKICKKMEIPTPSSGILGKGQSR